MAYRLLPAQNDAPMLRAEAQVDCVYGGRGRMTEDGGWVTFRSESCSTGQGSEASVFGAMRMDDYRNAITSLMPGQERPGEERVGANHEVGSGSHGQLGLERAELGIVVVLHHRLLALGLFGA